MNEHLSRVERLKEERKKKRKSGRKVEQRISTDSELSVLKEDELAAAAFVEHAALEALGEEIVAIDDLPTRKELFPSQRLKMTKLFYNSLLYIFIVIMGVLLWWAVKDSPWGKTQGF